jgi:hypothetical protein
MRIICYALYITLPTLVQSWQRMTKNLDEREL